MSNGQVGDNNACLGKLLVILLIFPMTMFDCKLFAKYFSNTILPNTATIFGNIFIICLGPGTFQFMTGALFWVIF